MCCAFFASCHLFDSLYLRWNIRFQTERFVLETEDEKMLNYTHICWSVFWAYIKYSNGLCVRILSVPHLTAYSLFCWVGSLLESSLHVQKRPRRIRQRETTPLHYITVNWNEISMECGATAKAAFLSTDNNFLFECRFVESRIVRNAASRIAKRATRTWADE